MSVLDLPARVSALEQELAQLQAQIDQLPPPADNLQPNVLTVNADGTIGATLTGKLNAEGIVFPAGAGLTNRAEEIDWTRTTDGALVARIAGAYRPGAPDGQLVLEADNPDNPGPLYARLLLETMQDGSASSIAAQIDGNPARTLLDGSDQSDWLQLATTSAQKLAFIVATYAWGTGNPQFVRFPNPPGLTTLQGFVGTAMALTTWTGVQILGSGLDAGHPTNEPFVAIANSTTVQNFNVYGLVWGT